MKERLTFSFIGGDLRQLQVISLLSAEGYHIRAFGFGESMGEIAEKVFVADSVAECMFGADYAVLPLPYSLDKKTVNAPLTGMKILIADVLKNMDTSMILLAGKVGEDIARRCTERNIKVYDYAKRKELAVMNAVPTAEGAIETAMSNTVFTLNGSRCLVVGYGRIGKVLANDLKALGAKVYATSRKKETLAEIEAFGYFSVPTSDIKRVASEVDIIFNTVPDLVLGPSILAATDENVLIIDLASRPGGVDFDEAERLRRRVIWALSLPGKVAPYTAGKIIKNTLINLIEESGCEDE